MKHFFNCIIFIIAVLLIYYLIQYIYALSKSQKPLITPARLPEVDKLNESYNIIIPCVKHTRSNPTIYNTTNMFQYN